MSTRCLCRSRLRADPPRAAWRARGAAVALQHLERPPPLGSGRGGEAQRISLEQLARAYRIKEEATTPWEHSRAGWRAGCRPTDATRRSLRSSPFASTGCARAWPCFARSTSAVAISPWRSPDWIGNRPLARASRPRPCSACRWPARARSRRLAGRAAPVVSGLAGARDRARCGRPRCRAAGFADQRAAHARLPAGLSAHG